MGMFSYVNGRMLGAGEARVSVEDAGFQHAVGLFETMSVHHGRAFRLGAHLQRLTASAIELGLARELDGQVLAAAVDQTIRHHQVDRARVRLTATAGNLSLLRAGASDPLTPTIVVTAQPPTEYDPAYFERGVTVLIAPAIANPFDAMTGHKTLSYWGRLRILRQAAAARAGEAIVLNISNHLASGTVSNVFLVKEGALLTPFAHGEEVPGALHAPVLPGVTRAVVIELALAAGIDVQRKMLSVDDLLSADEVFLTNSGWQILPVTSVEKQPIAGGQVGDLTKRLRQELLDLIEQETSDAS